MAVWDDLLTDQDREIIRMSGWGQRRGYGKNPALVVVDAQYMFVGEKMDIMDSLKINPAGIGQKAWDAIYNIQKLLKLAREAGIPVMYFKVYREPFEEQFNGFAMKSRYESPQPKPGVVYTDIVAEVAPEEGEVVIRKKFASGFVGTPAVSYLNQWGIDTLIVTGFVTSGCIRATAVDAGSLNYNTIVPEDCVADILEVEHKVNLLDIDLKYGDVTTMDEVAKYIEGFKNRS